MYLDAVAQSLYQSACDNSSKEVVEQWQFCSKNVRLTELGSNENRLFFTMSEKILNLGEKCAHSCFLQNMFLANMLCVGQRTELRLSRIAVGRV